MKVHIRTTLEADDQIREAIRWWVEHRSAAPDLLHQELTRAVELLRGAPDLGRRYRRRSVPGLRRLVLPRSRYHVYYVFSPDTGVLLILALWSAVRGRGPKLSKR